MTRSSSTTSTGWGRDFFTINDAGHVEVTPAGPGSARVDLKELVRRPPQPRPEPPLLIRFSDILRTRLQQLFGSFRQAIVENDYRGSYRGRVPDQGEPAAPRRRGADRVRAVLRPRPRGRIEARAARRPRPAGQPRRPGSLQRLQGSRLHRDRASRHKLGRQIIIVIDQIGELETILTTSARARHPPGDRRARAALHQGGRQVGRVDRRPLEVRPHQRRDRRHRRAAPRRGHARLPPAPALPVGSQITTSGP